MIRQIARLILLILVGIWSVVRKYPGPSLGVLIGATIGYIFGISMVKYGFPGWALPVMVIACAVKMALVCREYLDKLTK
jgi:hypothetical protein